MKQITILTTGGTIEKTYNEADGSLKNGPSIFRNEILSHFRHPHIEFNVYEVFSMDSLDMNDDSREFLLTAIQLEMKRNQPIVVIHGTDTMELSAQYLIKNLKSIDVPIVFTGAMKPMGFRDSDAFQNVAQSIALCQYIKSGVYICFHGTLFEGDRCTKDRQKGTFVPC